MSMCMRVIYNQSKRNNNHSIMFLSLSSRISSPSHLMPHRLVLVQRQRVQGFWVHTHSENTHEFKIQILLRFTNSWREKWRFILWWYNHMLITRNVKIWSRRLELCMMLDLRIYYSHEFTILYPPYDVWCWYLPSQGYLEYVKQPI